MPRLPSPRRSRLDGDPCSHGPARATRSAVCRLSVRSLFAGSTRRARSWTKQNVLFWFVQRGWLVGPRSSVLSPGRSHHRAMPTCRSSIPLAV
jgi:hypothetical protein